MTNTGYKQTLYYGKESTYGTAGTINSSFGLVQSVSPTENNSLIKIRTMGGTRDYSNIVPGKFEVSGSFSYYVQDGKFLAFAIGEAADADWGTTDAYVHTMGAGTDPGANDFPSFTLEFANTESTSPLTNNLKRVYTGCMVNTLGLSATVDEPLMANVDWIGRTVLASQAANTSVTDSTKDPYVFYQGSLYVSSGAAPVADVAIASGDKICELNSFDVSINNNLEALWYICSAETNARALKALVPKGRDWEGNIEIHFTNWDMYRKFLGSTSATSPQDTLTGFNVVLDFVRSGIIGGTKATTDDFMRIVLKDVKFDQNEISGSPEDIVSQSLTLSIESAVIYVVDNIEEYSLE